MLKNIVSGADKPEIDPNTFTYKGNAVAGGRATTTLLTSSQMVKQAQGILEKEFDKQYAIGASDPRIAYGNAVEFSESEKRAKFQTVTLNPSQIAMATKMGVPLSEYAKHLDALSK
jgi:hypothetical protein